VRRRQSQLRARSNHHKVDLAIFKAFPRQTIPGHLLNPVPVLTEIAGSLLLGRKFGLQATSLSRISVCNLKKDCCYQHVQTIMLAIDQYAESAFGNREYFLNKPHALAGRTTISPSTAQTSAQDFQPAATPH
jgi:hypothetical protein